MAKDFISKRQGNTSLVTASRQQAQLKYYLQSEIQEDLTEEYLSAFANRNFNTSDFFLNWVKQVLSAPNFLAFYKYFRHPIASTGLINDRIKDPLKRVFFADDSYFNYTIYKDDVKCPEELDEEQFNRHIFDALLFAPNNIMFTDLSDINEPFRSIIDITKVVAIESDDSVISKIAFEAVNAEGTKGYIYADDKNYSFYDKHYNVVSESEHDLGKCPANYIANEAFANDDIVRKSMFSHALPELEKYVFLKTLQRMTEVNGVMPVATVLESEDQNTSVRDNKGQFDNEPMSPNKIGGQKSQEVQRTVNGLNSPLNAGTKIEVPVFRKADGSIDTDVVQNFINFFYLPVEASEFLNKRIKEVEQTIIVSALGDFQESSEDAQNELQVSKSYVNKQDKLRGLSMELSRIRNLSDFDFLGLKYGSKNITVDCFYGSDFFIETENDLLEQFAKALNPVERRYILLRLAKSRNKFSKKSDQRDYIMYSLLPYTSDDEFKEVKDIISRDILELQTRFNYWINNFEARYGDLVMFWNSLEDINNGEKIVIINGLLLEMIRSTLPEIAQPIAGVIAAGGEGGEEVEPENDINAEAKARLKGSVGGVQGILEIQAAVAGGDTQYDAALLVLKEVYGFEDNIARGLLGKKPSTAEISAKKAEASKPRF